MDYFEIYTLTGDITNLTKELVGYIGKDGENVVIKNLTKDIDLKMFDKPIEKRWSEESDGILEDYAVMIKSSNKEWLKYLGENLERGFVASEIKTAKKLP